MRIAFLCKKKYTGHDVILDKYGRLYEIPRQLARMGHVVRGYCLDYHSSGHARSTHEGSSGRLEWESRCVGGISRPFLLLYPRLILQQLRQFKPDIIIGASDIPHVALATWLSSKTGIPCAIDLYDNFEGFGQARIPGFMRALHHAIHQADLIIAVTPQLEHMLRDRHSPSAPILVMPNGLDKTIFQPQDKNHARSYLNLPLAAPLLVGTAGHLHRDKGIECVYQAWSHIAAAREDVHLVLAGPAEKGFLPPEGERIHYLGNLSQADVASLFNALDVGVVSVLDSAFGRYCHPQKAFEMLACGLQVVAADVGATADLFSSAPERLFRPNCAESLASVVLQQLAQPTRISLPIHDWEHLVSDLEPALVRLCS